MTAFDAELDLRMVGERELASGPGTPQQRDGGRAGDPAHRLEFDADGQFDGRSSPTQRPTGLAQPVSELARIAPGAARVTCSGQAHTVIWRAGALELADHPDPGGERALSALGGAPCRCVELLDAWDRAATDPRALVLGPQEASASETGPDPDANRARGGGGTPHSSPPPDAVEELMLLGGALPQRLVTTVAAALTERRHEPALRAQLHAALYGRVLVALGRWLGALPDLTLEMIEPDVAPSLSWDGDRLRAALPFQWLIDVWGPDLATVAGRFTLAAEPLPSNGWKVCLVDQLMTVNTCTLSPS